MRASPSNVGGPARKRCGGSCLRSRIQPRRCLCTTSYRGVTGAIPRPLRTPSTHCAGSTMPDLQQETADLKALVREAHEVMKDLRQTMREAGRIRADVALLAKTAAEDVVDPVIVSTLETYQATIAVAIESAT